MQKIKLWIPFFSFLSHYGGAENQSQKLSRELALIGMEIKFITTKNTKNSRNIASNNDFEIIELPFLYKGDNSILRKISTFIYLLELFIYLSINNKKYDILQTFQMDKHSFVTMLCGLIFNKPVILREANVKQSDKSKENINNSFFQKNAYKLYTKAAAYIALNNEIKNEFIKDFNFNSEKIHLIPNGVEIFDSKNKQELRTKLNMPFNSFIGVCSARLEPQKNHILLFKAWCELIKNSPDSVLICLGDGAERKKYEEFILKKKCKNNIIFTGNVNNVQEYLQAADLFLLTSFYEGMSNALIEAMSFSCPCLVSDIEANRFLIRNEYNGLLFNLEESPEKLANLIDGLLHNQEKSKKLGENAKLTAKEFSITESAKKYYELYNSIVNL